MTDYQQPATLRVQVFLWGAILGRAGRQTLLHLLKAWGSPNKRNPLFDKLLAHTLTSHEFGIQPAAAG